MDSIVGVMKKVAEQEVRRIYTTELGIVTAIFPHESENDKNNYQCSVRLKNKKQPDGKDFELRQVPVATPHLGQANIPNMDDLVLVTFVGGDLNAPIIIGRLYNDQDQPPLSKDKEFVLQHSLKPGSCLKIDAEGTLTLTSQDEKTILTVADKTVEATTETSTLTLREGDIIAKNQQCEVTLKGGNITVSNGTCKLTIDGGGITLDAASGNVTIKGMGSIKIGDATTGGVQVGGRAPGNAVADNDDIILSSHTHVGNLGAPCPVMVPMEKINSIQAKARNTKVG
jgi:phage baseplate assembly protein gpV